MVLKPIKWGVGKINSETWTGILVGYTQGNAYRACISVSRRVFVTRNVTCFANIYKDAGSKTFNCENESTKDDGSDDETQIGNQESRNLDPLNSSVDEDVSYQTNNEGQYSKTKKLMP